MMLEEQPREIREEDIPNILKMLFAAVGGGIAYIMLSRVLFGKNAHIKLNEDIFRNALEHALYKHGYTMQDLDYLLEKHKNGRTATTTNKRFGK